MKTRAYAALGPDQPLVPFTLERRDPGPDDLLLDVLFCGICHSDVHQARGDWKGATFPMVPGHEIVGRVIQVGPRVTRFAVGDLAGVGCMVDSCGVCASCQEHHEQFCEEGPAFTYNSTEMDRSTPTQGGYAGHLVVRERFALRIPAGLDPAGAAPLLCAGITTYSPLRQWNCKKGDRVAVVGLGGLGHMGVKIAAAMGAEVTVLSTSADKEADAARLGAKGFAVTRDPTTWKRLARSFDLILDTISAEHDFNAHLGMLRPYGVMVIVGLPPRPAEVAASSLVGGNRRLAGSLIGGLKETQEMLDFCGERGLVADVEIIAARQVNEAYERMLRSDVRYRFVIDAATLKEG